MINLTTDSENTFILYVDTIDNDVQTFEDYFLLGFTNGFTQYTTYVSPNVVSRNHRFLKLTITLVNEAIDEDPLNSICYMIQRGNWNYKLYNTATSTLDPTDAVLLDSGQALLKKKMVS